MPSAMLPATTTFARAPSATRNGLSLVASPTSNPSFAETARLASLRRSTPDSETVFSSDDEHDMTKSAHSSNSKSAKQTAPSAETSGSWLQDIQSGPPRRASVATSTSNASQPMTPLEQLGDGTAWPFQNPLSRVSSNPVTSTWSLNSPWSQQPLSRLLSDDKQQSFNVPHNKDINSAYSFQVQPTSKSSRSQSYSVGQLDADVSPTARGYGNSLERQRITPSQQLPHRPTRPSMLSEVYQGSNSEYLRGQYSGQLSYNLPAVTSPIGSDGRRENSLETARNNPLLLHAAKTRARHSQSNSFSDNRSPTLLSSGFTPAATGITADLVIDEEPDEFSSSGITRRFSELAGLGGTHDSQRRSHWQSSLGFGALPDIPQSRRHSMAEIPTRRNSVIADISPGQTIDFVTAGNGSPDHLTRSDLDNLPVQDTYQQEVSNRSYAASYFSGVGPALRSHLESAQPTATAQDQAMAFNSNGPQNLYSRPGSETLLYLVSFKCARAEVYYVADNSGLQVKEGSLVIVEADRGQDLGTVLNAKLNWTQAKEMKARANEEHYRWLMMFSRHNQNSEGIASGGTGGMMAGNAMDRTNGFARPGYGPNVVDSGIRDTDLKPKMIKRLALPHEVATLRDKEGNEAKAKRICQTKVNDMKIDMEILDAEFQTDWKKLTFFYYAHSYVNFNALVTDLFKIYKTRIWMSAVNPASLNTAPIPPPRGLGPGAVVPRESTRSPRIMNQQYNGNGLGYGIDQSQNSQMYHNMNPGAFVDYGGSTNSAQHAYDMFSYPSHQAAVPQQSYGWSGLPPPMPQSYGAEIGSPWPSAFASGLGLPSMRNGSDPWPVLSSRLHNPASPTLPSVGNTQERRG